MTTHKEALTLALYALEPRAGMPEPEYESLVNCAITAIKEALAQPEHEPDEVDIRSRLYQRIHELETQLAQPEQEPVAWGVIASNTGKMCQVELDYDEVSDINSKWLVPLYTTPPQRKPLTDEQRMEMWRTTKFRGNGGQVDWFIEGTRAAEAAHGIKE